MVANTIAACAMVRMERGCKGLSVCFDEVDLQAVRTVVELDIAIATASRVRLRLRCEI